jgi:hypothetical protein
MDEIDVTTFFKETICDNLRLDGTPYEQEETVSSNDDTIPLDVIHAMAVYIETIRNYHNLRLDSTHKRYNVTATVDQHQPL